MSCLAPCPACNRHVATDETTCPFCAAALPDSFRQQNACRRPPGRLSRAAMVAAGAAMIGLPASCAGSAYGVAAGYDAGAADTSTIDGNQDGNTNDSSAVALYGVAPAQLEQAPPDLKDQGAPPPKPQKG